MIDFIDQIFKSFESGKISRRDAVMRLGGIMFAVFASPKTGGTESKPTSTLNATGLNHIALRVTDLEKSKDFYAKHLGLTVLRDNSPYNCFMGCGDNFLALFKADTPGLDHYCYTIDEYEPDKVEKQLQSNGIKTKRRQNRIYINDPDGHTTQISGQWDSWPGPIPERQ